MAKMFNLGAMAYLIAVFGSLILGLLAGLGLFEAGVVLTTILVVAGIIVGLMNIAQKEYVPVMVASLVLGAGSAVFAMLPLIGDVLASMAGALAQVSVPVAVVVAISALFNMLNK